MVLKTGEIDLIQMAEGNEEAWDIFFNNYKPILFEYAFYRTQNAEEAEDVVQDFFVRIWNNKDKLVNIEKPHSYFIRSILNSSSTHINKKSNQRFRNSYDLTKFEIEELGHTESDVLQNEVRKIIERISENLPIRQKEVFGHFYEDHCVSMREIGRRMECSHKNVQGLVHRLRRNFSKALILIEM